VGAVGGEGECVRSRVCVLWNGLRQGNVTFDWECAALGRVYQRDLYCTLWRFPM
jgi:hypothetical protein